MMQRAEVARVAPLLLSLPQAGAILSISASLTKRLVQVGELRSIKVGGRRLISLAALTEYVARREVEADEELTRLRAELAAREARTKAMKGAWARHMVEREAEAAAGRAAAS